MNRTYLAVAMVGALLSVSVEWTLARTVSATSPIQLVQDVSGGAASGRATRAVSAAAPALFANPFVIGGAVVTAGVVCALVCLGNSGSTTTTAAHH